MTDQPADTSTAVWSRGKPRTAEAWPAHRAKARGQKAQRRAIGREPRARGRKYTFTR